MFVQAGDQSGLKGVRGWFSVDEELWPEVWVVWDDGRTEGSCKVSEKCAAGLVLWQMFAPDFCWANEGMIAWSEISPEHLEVELELSFQENDEGRCKLDFNALNVVADRVPSEDLVSKLRSYGEHDPKEFWRDLLEKVAPDEVDSEA
ncbi:MAG: hypothetical protein AAF481_00800 [Acidobacteriota bacterium]